MTLAAGFNCEEGIYICADDKFTTGVSQFHSNKVFDVHDGASEAQFLVALAGHVDYGKMVIDLLERSLPDCTSAAIMEGFLHQAVRKVFKENIASIFQAGDQTRPQIEAIVVASFCKRDSNFQPRIWKVVDSSITSIKGFDAVGTGSDIARFYVRWLYPSMLDVHVPFHMAATTSQHMMTLANAFDPDTGQGWTARGISKKLPEGHNPPKVSPISVLSGPTHKEYRDLMYAFRQVFIGCIDQTCTTEMMQARLVQLTRAIEEGKSIDAKEAEEWATQTADARRESIENDKVK